MQRKLKRQIKKGKITEKDAEIIETLKKLSDAYNEEEKMLAERMADIEKRIEKLERK